MTRARDEFGLLRHTTRVYLRVLRFNPVAAIFALGGLGVILLLTAPILGVSLFPRLMAVLAAASLAAALGHVTRTTLVGGRGYDFFPALPIRAWHRVVGWLLVTLGVGAPAALLVALLLATVVGPVESARKLASVAALFVASAAWYPRPPNGGKWWSVLVFGGMTLFDSLLLQLGIAALSVAVAIATPLRDTAKPTDPPAAGALGAPPLPWKVGLGAVVRKGAMQQLGGVVGIGVGLLAFAAVRIVPVPRWQMLFAALPLGIVLYWTLPPDTGRGRGPSPLRHLPVPPNGALLLLLRQRLVLAAGSCVVVLAGAGLVLSPRAVASALRDGAPLAVLAMTLYVSSLDLGRLARFAPGQFFGAFVGALLGLYHIVSMPFDRIGDTWPVPLVLLACAFVLYSPALPTRDRP